MSGIVLPIQRPAPLEIEVKVVPTVPRICAGIKAFGHKNDCIVVETSGKRQAFARVCVCVFSMFSMKYIVGKAD